MSVYLVRLLASAANDLDQIIGWIAERSPDGATRLLTEFHKLLGILSTSAESYARAAEFDDDGYEIRQAFFRTRKGNTYRAIFLILGNEVRIVRIRGSGQPPLTSDEIKEQEKSGGSDQDHRMHLRIGGLTPGNLPAGEWKILSQRKRRLAAGGSGSMSH